MVFNEFLSCLHIAAAGIWATRHLMLLAVVILKPSEADYRADIYSFLKLHRKKGFYALSLLVLTGMALVVARDTNPENWLLINSPEERCVSLRVLLLGGTIIYVASAHFSVLPKLRTLYGGLQPMIYHIIFITLFGIALLALELHNLFFPCHVL
jgi:hypothetical protein